MYFLIRFKLLSEVFLLFKNTSFAILNSALRKYLNKQVQLLTKLPNTHKLTKKIYIYKFTKFYVMNICVSSNINNRYLQTIIFVFRNKLI